MAREYTAEFKLEAVNTNSHYTANRWTKMEEKP